MSQIKTINNINIDNNNKNNNNSSSSNDNNNNNNKKIPETRKHWVDVQWRIVSYHGILIRLGWKSF